MRLRQTYLGCTATAGSKVTKALHNQIFNHSIDIPTSGSACGEKTLAKGLFSKTNNYHEGHTSFMGWSGAWFAGVLKALGTKTVRISAGTNRSGEVCRSAAFCAVDGHCSAVAVA